MWESADGLRIAATRQCAGTSPTCAPRAFRCCPDATYYDAVIVVFDNDRLFKLSHGVCSPNAAKNKTATIVMSGFSCYNGALMTADVLLQSPPSRRARCALQTDVTRP